VPRHVLITVPSMATKHFIVVMAKSAKRLVANIITIDSA
jgi:hypothetical protein